MEMTDIGLGHPVAFPVGFADPGGILVDADPGHPVRLDPLTPAETVEIAWYALALGPVSSADLRVEVVGAETHIHVGDHLVVSVSGWLDPAQVSLSLY